MEATYRNPDIRLGEHQIEDNFVNEINLISQIKGIGVDVQKISTLGLDEPSFIERNFSLAEQEYCNNKKNPKQHYAGKWAAKEAVLKAIASFNNDGNKIKSGWDKLKNIEILNQPSGLPIVKLDEDIFGKITIIVSISHDGDYAVGYASVK